MGLRKEDQPAVTDKIIYYILYEKHITGLNNNSHQQWEDRNYINKAKGATADSSEWLYSKIKEVDPFACISSTIIYIQLPDY